MSSSHKVAENLRAMRACDDAVDWLIEQPSYEKAWATCDRGDWMLWLAGRLSGGSESDARKQLVLAACECARLALPHVKKGEIRPLKAIETAEAWARDEGPTLDDVRSAADAADAADAARAKILNQCADIVRKHYPKAPNLNGESND